MKLDDNIFISWLNYVLALLKRNKVEDCKPCSTLFYMGDRMTKEFDLSKVNATICK